MTYLLCSGGDEFLVAVNLFQHTVLAGPPKRMPETGKRLRFGASQSWADAGGAGDFAGGTRGPDLSKAFSK